MMIFPWEQLGCELLLDIKDLWMLGSERIGHLYGWSIGGKMMRVHTIEQHSCTIGVVGGPYYGQSSLAFIYLSLFLASHHQPP